MNKLLVLLLLLSTSALAAPAFVQKATGINAVSTSTVTSGSITTSAGNFLIILLAENAGTGLSSCSGQGATWTLLFSNPGTGGNNVDLHILYAKNIPGAVGAVTCTASAAQWMAVEVIEYSGVDTTNPIDSSLACGSDVVEVSAQCGPLTPVWDSQLVIGAWAQGGSATAPTADAPFTLRVGTNNGNEGSLRADGEDLVMVSDAAAKTASFSTPNTVNRMGVIMLKGAGANLLFAQQHRSGVSSQ